MLYQSMRIFCSLIFFRSLICELEEADDPVNSNQQKSHYCARLLVTQTQFRKPQPTQLLLLLLLRPISSHHVFVLKKTPKVCRQGKSFYFIDVEIKNIPS